MQDDSSANAQSPPQSHEQRECRSCLGTGWVMVGVEYDSSTGELTEEAAACPICKGAGVVSAFLYTHARRSQ